MQRQLVLNGYQAQMDVSTRGDLVEVQLERAAVCRTAALGDAYDFERQVVEKDPHGGKLAAAVGGIMFGVSALITLASAGTDSEPVGRFLLTTTGVATLGGLAWIFLVPDTLSLGAERLVREYPGQEWVGAPERCPAELLRPGDWEGPIPGIAVRINANHTNAEETLSWSQRTDSKGRATFKIGESLATLARECGEGTVLAAADLLPVEDEGLPLEPVTRTRPPPALAVPINRHSDVPLNRLREPRVRRISLNCPLVAQRRREERIRQEVAAARARREAMWARRRAEREAERERDAAMAGFFQGLSGVSGSSGGSSSGYGMENPLEEGNRRTHEDTARIQEQIRQQQLEEEAQRQREQWAQQQQQSRAAEQRQEQAREANRKQQAVWEAERRERAAQQARAGGQRSGSRGGAIQVQSAPPSPQSPRNYEYHEVAETFVDSPSRPTEAEARRFVELRDCHGLPWSSGPQAKPPVREILELFCEQRTNYQNKAEHRCRMVYRCTYTKTSREPREAKNVLQDRPRKPLWMQRGSGATEQ